MRHARAMTRRSTAEIPVDFRVRLEKARLDLLALFRALDRMHLSPAEIPQRLIRQLFELDADYVEALWALDQPPASLDLAAMLRDTLAALDQLPRPTLVTCRTGPRSSAVIYLYAGLRSGAGADEVLARAEGDGAPFTGSPELKAWVAQGLAELS